MKTIKNRIEEIKNNGYELNFGTVFENAFENYKKIALYAGSLFLISSFILCVFFLGIAIAVFGSATIIEALKPENIKPETFTGTFLLIYLALMLSVKCLLSPFFAGFLKMADCAENGKEFKISSIFTYYKIPFFGNIIVATFIITLSNSGLSLFLKSIGVENLGLLTSFTISFLTFLTIPFIVFGQLNAIEAIKSSAVVVSKQPLFIFGLLSISFIGASIGFFAFCIGMFFTIPFIYSIEYAIYKAIIGIESENEIDKIASNKD